MIVYIIVSISISVAVWNISCFVIGHDVLLNGQVIHCLNETASNDHVGATATTITTLTTAISKSNSTSIES